MKPTIRSSSLDRVLSCNGSLTLVPLVAPRRGTEADEGTDLHTRTAFRLVTQLGATGPESLKDYTYKPGGIADWISEFCYTAVKENTPPGWSLECEAELSHEFERFTLTGHPDVVGLSPDVTEFLIDDFKTGYAPVDIAEMNWQLLAYAVLLKVAYPTLNRGTVRIIQPRNDEDEGFPRISSAILEDLDAAMAMIESRVNAALDNAMEVNSGQSQCRWCPVSVQCPALQLDQQIMKLQLTSESLAAIKREPDDALLGDWVIIARTLRQPSEDATALLHERLDKVPAVQAGCGTQITRKVQRGSWSWPDPLKTYQAVKELLPTEASQAKVLRPSTTQIKDEVAIVYGCPKTGKGATTAEGIFTAKIAPTGTQGTRNLLVFQ